MLEDEASSREVDIKSPTADGEFGTSTIEFLVCGLSALRVMQSLAQQSFQTSKEPLQLEMLPDPARQG
jgi:hypothetical protein